jgi:hypothetical protein
MSSPVVFHEIKKVMYGAGYTTVNVKCGGKWYEQGKSPCEVMDAESAADLDNLPACVEDIEAMREVLSLPPEVTVCRFKGRASWDDKLPESPGVLPGTIREWTNVLSGTKTTQSYDGVRWVDVVTIPEAKS